MLEQLAEVAKQRLKFEFPYDVNVWVNNMDMMMENYHKKGGDYIIPVEVVNDIKNLIIELEKEKNNIFDTGIKECLRIRDMKDKEIERLNNIIKKLEVDLRNMYLTFGEFSEEYTENCIKKLKGENNE